MKIYHFANPHDYRFARAGRLGTWSPDPGPGACPECGRSRQKRIPPLIIEWLPDSDHVGDFTWPGLNDEVVVTQSVREALEQEFDALEFLPIKMFQDPKLKRPRRITRRTKPRIWLPYEGPPLWELHSTTTCSLDREQSNVRLEKVCSTCGRPKFIRPPFEDRHLVVDRATWGGEDIFKTREYTGWLFCTERAKQFVELQGFTNVGFLLDGEIAT